MPAKYKMIVADLTDKISHDGFHKGDKFYSEADIKRLYNVSSTTAVKVLNEMAQRDLIVRVQGKGSFVSKGAKGEYVRVTDIETMPGVAESVQVISIDKGRDPAILERLLLHADGAYFRFLRVKNKGERVVSVTLTYVPEALVATDKLVHKRNFISLYERFKADFGVNPYLLSYRQKNTVVWLEDPVILTHFGHETKKLLMHQQRVTFNAAHHHPIEWVDTYQLPELFDQEIVKEV